MTDELHTINAEQLARATGGIWYGENKGTSGERWAAGVDRFAKRTYDGARPYIGDTAAGVGIYLPLAVAETGARYSGRVWDAVSGGSK